MPKKTLAENPPEPRKRGPEPERVKIEGDWKDAVKKSLSKKKPATGWPKEKI
jgi:hypothetical protein